jgi:hypothetical protein
MMYSFPVPISVANKARTHSFVLLIPIRQFTAASVAAIAEHGNHWCHFDICNFFVPPNRKPPYRSSLSSYDNPKLAVLV